MDGNSALKMIKERTDIDFIILDINLNGENGLDLIPQFKTINNNIKILIYSAYTEVALIHNAIKSGINGYVTKGDSTDDLIKAVTSVIDGKDYYFNEVKEVYRNLITDGKYGNSNPLIESFNRFNKLSESEKNLFYYLSTNLTTEEIADKLKITPKTIRNKSSTLYEKLEVHKRQDIISMAEQLGIKL